VVVVCSLLDVRERQSAVGMGDVDGTKAIMPQAAGGDPTESAAM